MNQVPFPTISIEPGEDFGEEPLGSKEKFWFRRGSQLWLFKEARVATFFLWRIAVRRARTGDCDPA
ncbi:MAG: hypothetical protein WBJ68_11500 [Candidatus Dechloromonas phosphoritropha]|jgi:hypothetical protein